MTPLTRLAVIAGVMVSTLAGWAAGRIPGALAGLVLGAAVFVAPWRGQQSWRWLTHFLRRGGRLRLSAPVTVVSDRSGGGIRYQDGIATAAIRITGRRGQPTFVAGPTVSENGNSLEVDTLIPSLHQSLGLTMESLSVLSVGSRRRISGDYPKVYDTLIGNVPYAGCRETWLVLRLNAMANGQGLQCRSTVGSAALAAAQRVAGGLATIGVRARVATTAEITELDEHLGSAALNAPGRDWHTVRNGTGWMTTYAYRPEDIRTDQIALAWTIRADHVIQNVTVFPDRSCSATLTVQTPQPPTSSPSVMLKTLPGEQTTSAAGNLCAPRPNPFGIRRGPLPASLRIPIGPSGVLLGRMPTGERLLLPLSDPVEPSRIIVDAEDAITKRIIIRLVATGHRVSIHSLDHARWESLHMQHISITDRPHPVHGCTVSVVDGTVSLSKQPHTAMIVGSAHADPTPGTAQLTQTGPDRLDVDLAGHTYDVEFDFFRAEKRYVTSETAFDAAAGLQFAD